MSTPVVNNGAPVEIEIKEADKPFILAIIGTGITILTILVTAIGAYQGNLVLRDTGIDMLKYTFTLTTAAWVFYFGKKD